MCICAIVKLLKTAWEKKEKVIALNDCLIVN